MGDRRDLRRFLCRAAANGTRGPESAGAKLSATETFTLALPNRLFYDHRMIREAVASDAVKAVPLIMEAIGHIAFVLTGTTDSQEAASILSDFFEQEDTRIWTMRLPNGCTSDSGFARTILSGSRDRNTFTWYGVCDVPRRPGRASKREEFPGAGHYPDGGPNPRNAPSSSSRSRYEVATRGARRPADCKQEKMSSYSLLLSRQLICSKLKRLLKNGSGIRLVFRAPTSGFGAENSPSKPPR